MNLELLTNLLVNGVIVGTLYGVVAMCFVLIYKSTQVVNFAQGEFLLIGAWVCWALLVKFNLPFWIGFPITLVFMMLFGILLQVVALRPMIGEPIISVIMLTIGLSIFFQAAMSWMFGVFVKPFPQIFATEAVSVLGLQVQSAYIMSLVISVIIMVGFYYFFGIKVFPAVILGGLDSIVGAIVGGLIIGILENLAEFFDSQFFHVGNMYTVAPFYILVIILMIKPYGLFGTKDIERI